MTIARSRTLRDTSVKDNFYEDSKSEQKHLKTAMDQNFRCRV